MDLSQIDLNKIHHFLQIAENGSVSEAARSLHLTRSAVSQSLSALEEKLQMKLFHRIGKKLVLTPEGESLHRKARRSAILMRQALEEIQSRQFGISGEIRVGLFVGFHHSGFSKMLAEFLEEFREIRFRVFYLTHQELVNRLLNNLLDVSFTVYRPNELEDRLNSQLLVPQKFSLVGNRKWIDFEKPTIEQLLDWPIVDYYRSNPVFERWLESSYRIRKQRFQDRIHYRAFLGSAELVTDVIEESRCIGVIPERLAQSRSSLQVIEGPYSDWQGAVWFNQLRSDYRSPAVEEFRKRAVQKLKSPFIHHE